MLQADCLAHARLMFYRDAIDVSLEEKNWEEALRHASALEAVVRPEPLPFAELVAERARVLVALARQGAEPEIMARLGSLRDRIQRSGLGGLVPGIEDAMASV